MYARKQRVCFQRNPVAGGTPISEKMAIDLRKAVFGSPFTEPRLEWTTTGFDYRDAEKELAYGLRAPRNSTRGLLSVVQAHVVKYLLFDRPDRDPHADVALRPSHALQQEALWMSLSAILWKIGEKTQCCVCLPQDIPSVPQSERYCQDGITEKLHLFEFTCLDDLQIFIKRYIYLFQEATGSGTLLLLYSAVLTRGIEKVLTDMDGEKTFILGVPEEGSHCIVTLLLTGRATPYLHNGVVYVGDEDHYALPHFGILSRSDVGFLLWNEALRKRGDDSLVPGSRLKTPSLPVWVSNCSGHYGVLFNTNRELLRNYHAERRFDLHYYSCGGSYSHVTVDTRFEEDDAPQKEQNKEGMGTPPLEKLIHTKWEDAHITWHTSVGGIL